MTRTMEALAAAYEKRLGRRHVAQTPVRAVLGEARVYRREGFASRHGDDPKTAGARFARESGDE